MINNRNIIEAEQLKQSQKYLTYCALQEIMLDNYEDCNWLKIYDHHLLLKHKNIINTLKQKASFAYKFIQDYDDGEEAIKQFHNFVTIHEKLHEAIDSGGDLLTKCLDAIEIVMKNEGVLEENF